MARNDNAIGAPPRAPGTPPLRVAPGAPPPRGACTPPSTPTHAIITTRERDGAMRGLTETNTRLVSELSALTAEVSALRGRCAYAEDALCAAPPAFSLRGSFVRRVPPFCLSQGGVPKLIMGKMQLEGTEVKLKKPLAIMTLIKPDEGSTEYHTAGVVRQKLVFRTRPVPASRPPLPEPSTLCGSKRTRSDEPVASPLPPPRK